MVPGQYRLGCVLIAIGLLRCTCESFASIAINSSYASDILHCGKPIIHLTVTFALDPICAPHAYISIFI